MPETGAPRVLVIGCGALARELIDIVDRNGLDGYTIECLPGILHNTPQDIAPLIAERIDRAQGRYDQIFVAYGDCGTRGELDAVLADRNVERLPNAHCFEFYAGTDRFAALQDDEPGTFYLTDYLARHFDRFVWQALGLDRHPELRDAYFGNYRRVVYLAQRSDPGLSAKARAAADRLDLEFVEIAADYGELEPALVGLAEESG